MNVLVDTCVWSRALRQASPDEALAIQLKSLIIQARVVLIGPIRQELLSGISETRQFHVLKEKLAPFEDLPLTTEHFEKAAEFCNLCRRKGIQGSTIDFLICAVAALENIAVFTVDGDFDHYKKHLPFSLFSPESDKG